MTPKPAPSVDEKPREFWIDDGLLRDENGFPWLAVIYEPYKSMIGSVHLREVLPEQESEITALKAENERVTKFKNEYERLMNEFNKSYQAERRVTRDIENEIASLKSELAEARKDSERLEWMIENRVETTIDRTHIHKFIPDLDGKYENARRGIDAAINSHKGEVKCQ